FPGSLPGEGRTEGYYLLDPTEAGFSSNLPIVLLSTFGKGSPEAPNGNRKESFMLIYEPDPLTGRASFSDTPTVATRSGIRKRGSSSAGFAKYAMSLESWDEFNEDKDIKPLGLSSEADWILNARYTFDYSLIRNPFLYELSNQIGRWAVKTRFVELYNDVNGGKVTSNDYSGVYTFMEKIEPDNNRLDISKLDPWENSPEEVTGGYVFKNDRADTETPVEPTFFVSGFQRSLVYVDPDGFDATATQKSYLSTHANQVTTALRQANGIHPTTGLHFSDYLDVDSFIDNFWLNILAMDPDWGRLSQFFYKDRGGKIMAGPVWDYDRAMGSRDWRDDNPLRWEANTDDVSSTWFDLQFEWFGLLFGFQPSDDDTRNMLNPQLKTSRPDVFQKIIDRWYELRSDKFAQANLDSIVDTMAAEISEAQARNFARWSTLDVNSITGINYATEGVGWNRQISHLKGWLKARSEWIDTRFFSPPTFSQNGGIVADGFQLNMTVSQGGVYYTTDGSDPRAPGGAPAGGAINGGMVTLNETTTVTARAYDGAQWGAPTIATFVIGADLASPSNLVISEIMYQPAEPTQDEVNAGFINNNQFEYLELMNISGNTIDLTNVSFADGIDFTFAGAAITVLAPGARVLIVRDQNAFAHRYGLGLSGLIAGEFANDTGLSGSGEQIILIGFSGDIRNFTYNDKYPWPEAADGDGDGPSLVLIAPVSNPNHDDAINWRASVGTAGSAGGSDALSFTGNPTTDADRDGLNAFAEYAYGTDDLVADGSILTTNVDANGRFNISFPKNLAADDALVVVEVSTDMSTWTVAGDALELGTETHNGDGTSTFTLRTPNAAVGEAKFFVRLRVYER
ncbi:CotH kinase family protein, partial [Akkermansiaceae bacterium]|nr:CotH kinase family protein [Akkermansiaceae bacterium]